MWDLDVMRRRAQRVCHEAERGYDAVPMKVALADLALPLLEVIEVMESNKGARWLTLEEVIRRTGWTRKYFDKKLVSLGGRSRLEVWAENGDAVKAPPGIWLISPTRVPSPRPGHEPLDSDQSSGRDRSARSQVTETALDHRAIADDLLGRDVGA